MLTTLFPLLLTQLFDVILKQFFPFTVIDHFEPDVALQLFADYIELAQVGDLLPLGQVDFAQHFCEVFTTSLLNFTGFTLLLLSDFELVFAECIFSFSNCLENFNSPIVLNDAIDIVPLPVAVDSFLAEHLLKDFGGFFLRQRVVIRVC